MLHRVPCVPSAAAAAASGDGARSIPEARSGHMVTEDGVDPAVFYVYGGQGRRRFDTLHRCTVAVGDSGRRRVAASWDLVVPCGGGGGGGDQQLPAARCKGTLTRHGRWFYLFGGWGEGRVKLNDFWRVAISGNGGDDDGGSSSSSSVARCRWERLRCPVPPARSSHSCAAVGPLLYLFGGIGDQKYNDLWVFDTRAVHAGWRLVPSPAGTAATPARRSSYGGLVADAARGRLVLFGGLGCGQFNDAWALESVGGGTPVASPVWRRLATTGTPPSKRGRHASCLLPGGAAMLVAGGTDLRRSFGGLHVLDLATLAWTELPRAVGGGGASSSSSAAAAAAAAFSPKDSMVAVERCGRVFLHGGCADGVWYDSLWALGGEGEEGGEGDDEAVAA